MDKLRITGGRPLEGEVRISGAKNAALPIMCAALLTSKPLVVSNVPRLRDVSTMAKLLGQMGVELDRSLENITLRAKAIADPTASYELVKTMRASVLVLVGNLVLSAWRGARVTSNVWESRSLEWSLLPSPAPVRS